MPNDPRPSRAEYLMSMAVDQAARCNCRKTAVGAVISRDDRVICTGYNGTIGGFKNCIDGGCPRCSDGQVISGTQLDRCICVHAEQNALLTAARFGVGVQGSTCWVTTEPCLDCTKQLIQAELKQVIYWKAYALPNKESGQLRSEMREHSKETTEFAVWSPETDILNLEERYKAIKLRLDNYVRGAG